MRCLANTPAIRTYFRRFGAAMTAYIALIVFDGFYFWYVHPTGPVAYVLAVLPGLAIIGQIVAVGLFLRDETDEFQRNLFVETLLWGLGGVLSVASVWGVLETYTHVPHLQPMWIFPIFWFFVGISSPIVMWRYR